MSWEPEVIRGHPAVEAHLADGRTVMWTVCANCESLRSVLFLAGDRWYCVKCRNEGNAKPTQVFVSKPTKE